MGVGRGGGGEREGGIEGGGGGEEESKWQRVNVLATFKINLSNASSEAVVRAAILR